MKYRVTAVLLLIAPTSAWGQLFVRRPLHLADRSDGLMADWQDCSGQLDAYQCGEVAALLPAGSAHVAHVTAEPLKSGRKSLRWEPSVRCASVPIQSHVQACSANRNGRTLWQISGHLTPGQSLTPGAYRGAAIVTIEVGGETWSVRVPVSLALDEMQPTCALSGGGHMDFGRAEGMRAGSITLDPVQASRKYAGQPIRGPYNQPYKFANMTLRSGAARVTVTVRAPSQLSAASASVDYTSLLAYRDADRGPWTMLMSGSGSRTVENTSGKALQFRLGGIVTTDPLSPESRYSGTVEVSVHCGPNS